jgi:hypothetical protein
VPREAYKKHAESGVVYADLRPGSGADIVKEGTRGKSANCNLQEVKRLFVDSSRENGSVPFIHLVMAPPFKD